MNFIAQTKQGGKVDAIFPVLHELALAVMESNVQLKQTIDVLRGVNLLKAPPRVEQLRSSELKKHSFYVNPLIPAIESSGLHLRNALSFIVNSDDDNDLGNVIQILQVIATRQSGLRGQSCKKLFLAKSFQQIWSFLLSN